jgi:hypothetical protein
MLLAARRSSFQVVHGRNSCRVGSRTRLRRRVECNTRIGSDAEHGQRLGRNSALSGLVQKPQVVRQGWPSSTSRGISSARALSLATLLSVARLSANSVSMNLRHAAALALVGWYLMTPPIIAENGVAKADPTAPLSQWTHGGRIFHSKGNCETQRKYLDAESHKTPTEPIGSLQAMNRGLETLTNTLCIRSDDPRLKGK